jgi:Ser-tRNA(Ala) deacylase AlaX
MTQLEFLEDTFIFESQAKVINVETLSDPKENMNTAVYLDSTIFYPQGGGQPADSGVIYSPSSRFIVTHTSLSPETLQVLHKGYFEGKPFEIDETVKLEINKEKRILYSSLHTYGHLLGDLVDSLNVGLVSKKGYHFPDGPNIEFEGSLSGLTKDEIEKAVNEKIKSALDVVCTISEEVSAKGNVRYIQIGEYNKSPCGGTHLKKLNPNDAVIIRKISSKKGLTKISYQVVFGDQ